MTEMKCEAQDNGSSWSGRSPINLRGCTCCLAFIGCGCLAVLGALVLCFAAGLLAISSTISFISNLLFGAA